MADEDRKFVQLQIRGRRMERLLKQHKVDKEGADYCPDELGEYVRMLVIEALARREQM